jgi:hypothetical protein
MCIENAVMSRRMNLYEVPENAGLLGRLTAWHLISGEKFNRAKAENYKGSPTQHFRTCSNRKA